jgi:hypothetical protein
VSTIEGKFTLSRPPGAKGALHRVVVWQIVRGYRLRVAVQVRRSLANVEATARRLFGEALPHADLSESERADFIARLRPGDNCRGCGRAYSSNEPILAGFSHTGAPLEVGACCASLVAFGAYFLPRDVPPALLAQLPTKGRA